MSDYCNASTERLFRTLANVQTPEECRALLEDLCTVREIQDMAQRLDTAILLDQGVNYQKIVERVGVSTATISRVNRCLQYGSNGYRTAIDRMAETEKTYESQ